MIDRIDHFVLNCRNVEATASWYERALGFRQETDSNLCFVTGGSLKPVIARLEVAGIPIVAGPAPRSDALGPYDVDLLRGSGWQSG